MNEATGEVISISKAHLVVKHQNVADAEITAEIAMRNATFVSGEVIGIGTGAEQTVSLANTNNLSAYKFALYVNGVQQTGNFSFYETSGQVTFIAFLERLLVRIIFTTGAQKNSLQWKIAGHIPTIKR